MLMSVKAPMTLCLPSFFSWTSSPALGRGRVQL